MKFRPVDEVFKEFSFLNISMVAEFAKINPTLLRHYAAGTKKPSAKQLAKIQRAFISMGNKLLNTSLVEREDPAKRNQDKLNKYLEKMEMKGLR